MMLRSSFLLMFSAIFWLCYECAHGMPKNNGASSSNDDQQQISKETRKWLNQIIEFIDKQNPKQFYGIEENEQINDEKEFNENKNELREKLKKSKKEVVTREDEKKFFELLNNFLKDIETKMTKKLEKLEAYNAFRIKKTIENEIKTPKKQKEITKLEKCICKNQKTNIENNDLDKTALEAIQLFKKLQILNCLATDKKQKEISEYFDIYYYQQQQQALKEKQAEIDHANDRLSDDDNRCIKPCCATQTVIAYCMNYLSKDRNDCEYVYCGFTAFSYQILQNYSICISIASLPVSIPLCACSCAASTAIDACVSCCYGSYNGGSARVNEAKKGRNKKKQEKIEKHLTEITPP